MLSVLLKCSSHAVISHRNHEKGMESLPEQRFWGCFWSKQSTVAVLFPLALLWQRTEIGQGRVSTVTQLMVLQGKESKTGGCQRLLYCSLTHDMRGDDTWRKGQWQVPWGAEPPFHTHSEFYILRKAPHSFYHFPLSRAWKTLPEP